MSIRKPWPVLFAALLLPILVHAEKITGKINGLQCATSGFVCPVDKVDAMLALERDFVIQRPNGVYYTMTNVDRAVKAKYALQEATVTGTVSDLYKAIDVDTLQVGQKTVWSKKMQEDLQAEMMKHLYHGSK